MSVTGTPTIAGRLHLPRAVAAPGDELEYRIANTGEMPIMFDAAYALEHHGSAAWQPREGNAIFRTWGRTLTPGTHYMLTARLPKDLPAGRYRLRKRLRADIDPRPGYEWTAQAGIEPVEATAEFIVEAS